MQQTLNNGEAGLSFRNKLNDNFSELYARAPTLAFWDHWAESYLPVVGADGGVLAGAAVASGTGTSTGGLAGAQDGYWMNGVQLQSSATANSGFRYSSTSAGVLFGVTARKCLVVFRPTTFALVTTRVGFHDTVTSALPVDGAWIDIAPGGVATGRTASNSVTTATVSNFALSANVAYAFDVVVNAAGTLATFAIYNANTGALLWTDTLATNIPVGATTRSTNSGIITTHSGTASVQCGLLYMLGFGTPAGYARARGA